jgi:hypothetical protein
MAAARRRRRWADGPAGRLLPFRCRPSAFETRVQASSFSPPARRCCRRHAAERYANLRNQNPRNQNPPNEEPNAWNPRNQWNPAAFGSSPSERDADAT